MEHQKKIVQSHAPRTQRKELRQEEQIKSLKLHHYKVTKH